MTFKHLIILLSKLSLILNFGFIEIGRVKLTRLECS